MSKYRIASIIILILAAALGYFVYATEADGKEGRFDFKLGLDLAGGTHLTYDADVSELPQQEVSESMSALRDVIESRVNLFGVSEPVVQVEETGGNQRLIVELPGVTDIDEAVEQIGATPVLEFRLFSDEISELGDSLATTSASAATSTGEVATSTLMESFESTGLSGRQVEGATLQFDQVSGQPIVALQFNSEGEELFAEITRENVGEILGIFLDGAPISLPVINEEIRGGEAVISGGFSVDEARALVRDLRFGALPVPIELVGTQTIGPTLGAMALEAGVLAGLVGFSLVVIFLIIWYRLPGLLASLALVIYIIINLAIFKLVPVTLSAAGLAGFILSIGMAVDANILIFERLKEELLAGKGLLDSIGEGFKRAWLSIRDGNISTIITAVILFYTTTSLVRGFALTLGIGVLISIFTAITITRTFLLAVVPKEGNEKLKVLFKSGVSK